MSRRLTKRIETFVETDYDYEGNPYEHSYGVEILSVWEGDSILWEGTQAQAHAPCEDATNTMFLPGMRADAGTRQDALWSLVAPYAHVIPGAPSLRYERSMSMVEEIETSRRVYVPGRTSTYLSVLPPSIINPEDYTYHEWLIVLGDGHRVLANGCHLVCSDDDALDFLLEGESVVENHATTAEESP